MHAVPVSLLVACLLCTRLFACTAVLRDNLAGVIHPQRDKESAAVLLNG